MPKTAKREPAVISTASLLLIAMVLLLVVIVILLLGFGLRFGMMNGLASMMDTGIFGGVGASNFGAQVSIGTSESYANVLPQHVQRYANNDTLLFSSSNITLVIFAMGVQRAINLTHEPLPLYDSNGSGNAFVIYGLINPTLVVPKGAIIHVEFINLDSSEYHNVIMTATGPPYQYMPMSAMNGIVSMMPVIPPADYSGGYATEYNYTTAFDDSGAYWCLCTYPGHAQMGMYGKIIVE